MEKQRMEKTNVILSKERISDLLHVIPFEAKDILTTTRHPFEGRDLLQALTSLKKCFYWGFLVVDGGSCLRRNDVTSLE